MATHPLAFVGPDPKIDNKYKVLNGETIYDVERIIGFPSQTRAVYTDNENYFTYCDMVYKDEIPSEIRTCNTTLFYGNIIVDITFDGKHNFKNRFNITAKVRHFLQSIGA